jgi:hypothetical protein
MAEGTIKRLTTRASDSSTRAVAKICSSTHRASKASVLTPCVKVRRFPTRKDEVRKALVPRTSRRCSSASTASTLIVAEAPESNRGMAECPNRGRIQVAGQLKGRADTPGSTARSIGNMGSR